MTQESILIYLILHLSCLNVYCFNYLNIINEVIMPGEGSMKVQKLRTDLSCTTN